MKIAVLLTSVVLQVEAAAEHIQNRMPSTWPAGFIASPAIVRGGAATCGALSSATSCATSSRRQGTVSMMAGEGDTSDTYTLVLVRHGQSTWNKENKFTGWQDVPLSEQGREEAQQAGELIKSEGLEFDLAYTSVLKVAGIQSFVHLGHVASAEQLLRTRAIQTLWLVLEGTDLMWIPVKRSWRLNERHYGALTGLDKQQTVDKHGKDQVMIWRRSYDTPPPPLGDDSDMLPKNDRRYADVPEDQLPRSESLKLTKERFMPEWEDSIVPDMKAGKRVLIAAHGNSLRALAQHLDNISDEEIAGLDIPTGVPLIYKLDKKTLKPVTQPDAIPPLSGRYLGDVEGIRKKIQGVKDQTK